MKRILCLGLAAAFLAAPAFAVGTVTVTLTSPVAGTTITPGTTVDWSIRVAVSTGDNFGLALLACDLAQDGSNPAKFDIPPGNSASIPVEMAGFDRPGGITNPGENGNPSGYVGVQRGTAGEKNLVQIGGAQNTFGQAGTVFGTDPNVDQGIGQGGSPQLIVSGSFPAPSTAGVYTFRIQNALANVLTSVGVPPQFSQVSQATVDTSAASFSFTVQTVQVCRGDLNCDGQVDFGDINPFVKYVSGCAAWQAAYPNCPGENGDINLNGNHACNGYPFDDINSFVNLLSTGQLPIICR